MSANLLKTPKQVFDYLKRYDSDFREMKKESEYKSWNDFENAFFKDKDLVKWLESQIDEINDKKRETYSKAQLSSERRKANKKIGRRNVESGHLASLRTPDHQRNASVKGKEAQRKIRAERLELFIVFMMENLPKEFTFDDIDNIRNNNQDNTLFHKSWKNTQLMRDYVIRGKFIKEAIKRNLIVKVRGGGGKGQLTLYHKINEISSIENKEEVVEQVKHQETKQPIQTGGYFQSSTYGNINLIY